MGLGVRVGVEVGLRVGVRLGISVSRVGIGARGRVRIG